MQTCQVKSSLPTQSVKLPRSHVSKTQLANNVLSAHKKRSNSLCPNLNRNNTPHYTLMGLAQLAVDLACEASLEELISQKVMFGAFVNNVSVQLESYVNNYTKHVVDDLLPSFLALAEALGVPEKGFNDKVHAIVKAMPQLRLTIYNEVSYWHQHHDNSVSVTAWMEDLDTFPYKKGVQENKNIVASVLAQFEKFESELNSGGVGMLGDYGNCFDPDTLGLLFADKPLSKAELEQRKRQLLAKAPSYNKNTLENLFNEHESEINEHNGLIASYNKGSREKTLIDNWFGSAFSKYPVVSSEGMIQSSSGDFPFMLPLSSGDEEFQNVQDDYSSYDSPPYILKIKGENALEYVRNSINASVIMGMLFSFCN